MTHFHTQNNADGFKVWKGQRLSAVVLIMLGIWFLASILNNAHADYSSVLTWAAQPWISALLALFVGTSFYHSALGLQVIIEDYIPHPLWQKILIYTVNIMSFSMVMLSWFFILRIMIIGSR